jgi:hypothetical protein
MSALEGKMAKVKAWEVTEEFWSRVQPLTPERQRIADQTYTRHSIFTDCFREK